MSGRRVSRPFLHRNPIPGPDEVPSVDQLWRQAHGLEPGPDGNPAARRRFRQLLAATVPVWLARVSR